MSQGIFGVIDFSEVIESPAELAYRVGSFLRNDEMNNGGISYIFDHHYLLGMKRIFRDSSSHQMEIAKNTDLHILSLMHGEINNYQDLFRKYLPNNMSCQGDLALAIHLYHLHGAAFAQKLDGLFVHIKNVTIQRQKLHHNLQFFVYVISDEPGASAIFTCNPVLT